MSKHLVAAALICAALGATVTVAAPAPFAPPRPDARAVSHLDSHTAILHWTTATPCETQLQLREGGLPASTPGEEGAWENARTIRSPGGVKTTDHALVVRDLEPATRYFYRRYDPDAEPSDREKGFSAEPPWTREYGFATRAAPGETAFVRIPMKVLLVPNVIELSTVDADAPEPEPMSEEEIEIYKRNFAESVLFYWVNSSMRYWIDPEFFVEPEWQRRGEERDDLPEFYKGWPHSRDGLRVFDTADISNHDAKWPMKDDKIYSGQTIVICERRWDAEKGEWYFQGSGGGTFGIDWMIWGDETQRPAPGRSTYLGGSDIAWLNTHEYHHQKESQYHFSGLTDENDRVVFCHFAPHYTTPTQNWKWDTAFAHGEHWDGIAWELRALTIPQYLRNIFGEITVAKDTDGDGIPDDDPRLPLDEKRLGSDPESPTTDGATPDMERVLAARWVPATLAAMRTRVHNPGYEGMWSLAAGEKPDPYTKGSPHYAWVDFRTDDSDRDGLADAEDPYPIYPWTPEIARATVEIDGSVDDWAGIAPIGEATTGDTKVEVRAAIDHDNLYYMVRIEGPYRSTLMHIDGDADGWYVGNDNLQIRIEPGEDDVPMLREAVAHVCGNRGWPYFDNGGPVRWKDRKTEEEWTFARPKWYGSAEDITFVGSRDGDAVVAEFAIPNGTGRSPVQAGPGHPIGLAMYVGIPDSSALSVYEPYTLFVAEVAETALAAAESPAAD